MPAATAVTVPAEMVASALLVIPQVPPVVVSVRTSGAPPMQTNALPLIAATVGSTLAIIVTGNVAVTVPHEVATE